MSQGRKWPFTASLLLIAILIHLYSQDHQRVESQYSLKFFPLIAKSLRYLFGWLPFSLGDLIYTFLIACLLVWLVKAVVKRGIRKSKPWKENLLKGANLILLVYISFNILWGLNYNRKGILHQLNIGEAKYSKDDLLALNSFLLTQVNLAKEDWIKKGEPYPGKKKLFQKVGEAYEGAAGKYPFVKYKPVSLKPSIWSLAGNYLGFTGYYNPFTGEAQVNTTIPKFLQPFTACHEVAHQLGYAKEMEANFVGFLAAENSADPLLRYSLYLDLFFYANRNLGETDSVAANKIKDNLMVPVKNDISEWRAFRLKHRSFLKPVFRWVYGKFLERNQQPQGMLSYDEVTSFVIAYYKKKGILKS